MDPTPEFNMIQAASRSRVTKRFIPNAWSSVEPKDEYAPSPTLPLSTQH